MSGILNGIPSSVVPMNIARARADVTCGLESGLWVGGPVEIDLDYAEQCPYHEPN